METKKNKLIIVVFIVVIFLSLFGWQMFFKSGFKNVYNPVVNSEATEKKVSLLINNGKERKDFQIEFKQGMTAFDILKNKAEELNLNLKIEQYDSGIFIKAIGGVENGTDNKYWLYYVNGKMPSVAADKNMINIGDKVEFKFEKSPF